MINHIVECLDFSTVKEDGISFEDLAPQSKLRVANLITAAEQAKAREDGHLAALRAEMAKKIGDAQNSGYRYYRHRRRRKIVIDR